VLERETEREMTRVFLDLLAVIIALLSSVCFAQDQLKPGMNAPTSIVARFISGDWAKQGSACPILNHRNEVKIAIYVKRAHEPVLPLIATLDELVAEHAALKWSFVFVSHENSPTPNQVEWDAELVRLKKLTSDRNIQHLSFGLLLRDPENGKPVGAKPRLGFFGDGDIVVMLIRPDEKVKRGVIHYLSVLKSEELDAGTIQRIASQLRDGLAEVSFQAEGKEARSR
jgi:hypothetical protein